MTPFDYPTTPLVRRHLPVGYADYASFRPWLRDDFNFRCVYCLRREQWGRMSGEFEMDHFLPVTQYPDQATEYDNLLYACSTCNNRKRSHIIPDPTQFLMAGLLTIFEDGSILGHTAEACRLIRLLDLDGPDATDFRAMWIGIIRLAKRYDTALLQRLLGFPDDLPDLSQLRPPGGNRRPEGIEQSYFARRERGELPDTY
jgi:hypothetical protein